MLGNADTDRQNRVNFVLSAAQQGNIRAAQIILGAPPNVSGNERGMWTTAASKIGSTDLGKLALQEAQSRGPTWLTGNGDTASNHPGLNLFLSQSPMAVPAPEPTAPPPPVPVTPVTPTTPPPPPVPVIPPTPTAPPVEIPKVDGNTDAQRQGRVNYVVQNAQRGNIRAGQILLGGPDNVSGNERDMWTNGQKNAAATDLGAAAMVAAMAKGPQWLTGNGDTAANYPGLVQFLIGSDIAHPVVDDIPTPVTPTQPTYPTTPGGGGGTIPIPLPPDSGGGFGSGPFVTPPSGPGVDLTPGNGPTVQADGGLFGLPPLAIAAAAVGVGLLVFGKKR